MEGSTPEDELDAQRARQALLYVDQMRALYRGERARADELEKLKESLQTAIRRLEQLEDARDRFLASVSQEIRTPLTAIIGWAETLRTRGELPHHRVVEAAETIAREGRRLYDLVETMLQMASSREKGRVRHSVRVDVGAIVKTVAETARDQGRPVSLSIDARARWACSEESFLRDVLVTLVDNALRSSPPGTPVDFDARRIGDDLLFSVIDHGSGVQPSLRERIFDVPDPAGEGDESGGLFVCARLVSAYGGRIWVSDTPGRGTTFTFSIPQRRASDAIVLDQRPEGAARPART